MVRHVARYGRYAVALGLAAFALSGVAAAQGRTDVVSLANGDRITGEVTRLERGRLEFDTDDAGTLYLEWDKLVNVLAPTRTVEVLTSDGRRFVGALGPAAARTIAVVSPQQVFMLAMSDVTLITPIGGSFWSKLDGSIDAGFNYTQSSGVAQFNLNSETIYRKLASRTRLMGSLTLTQTEDSDRDDRGSIDFSYLRYPWQRWFFAAAGRLETNESLGIALRSQIGGAVGPRLINSNRAQMIAGAGLALNDERGVDVEATQNVEALFLFQTSFYTYDRPKTNLDLNVQYFPSLSDPGRQRVQLDTGVKRELLKDFFVSISAYETFDSRPPNPDSNENDVGMVVSLGWSY